MEKVKVPWANNEEEFKDILQFIYREWVITEDNRLFGITGLSNLEWLRMDNGKKAKIKHFLNSSSSILDTLVHSHITSWLRLFCEEHHPEVDFDEEFKTDEPGVFWRYHEKFGYDFGDWTANVMHKEVKVKLAELGYELPWD